MVRRLFRIVALVVGLALLAGAGQAQTSISRNSYGDVVWCGGQAYFLEFTTAADRLANGRIVRYSPARNASTVLLERDRRIDLQGCIAGTGEIVFSAYDLRSWEPREMFFLQPQSRAVEAAGKEWQMLFQTASGTLVVRGSIYDSELPEDGFDRRKLTVLTTASVIALRRPGEPAAVLHAFEHHGRSYEYPGYDYFVRPTLDNRGLVVTELALRRLSTFDLVIADTAKPTIDWLPPSDANIIAYDRVKVLRTQLLWREIVARRHVDPAALTLCEAREQDYVCGRRAFGGREIETRSLKRIGNGARYVFLHRREIAGAKVQCVVLAKSLFAEGECLLREKPDAVLELYPSPDGRFIVVSRQGAGWRSHDELGHEVHDNPPQELLLIRIKDG